MMAKQACKHRLLCPPHSQELCHADCPLQAHLLSKATDRLLKLDPQLKAAVSGPCQGGHLAHLGVQVVGKVSPTPAVTGTCACCEVDSGVVVCVPLRGGAVGCLGVDDCGIDYV